MAPPSMLPPSSPSQKQQQRPSSGSQLHRSFVSGPTLRKLLPKVGFSWPLTRKKNKHTRVIEHRLAGLSASERSRIMKALKNSVGGSTSSGGVQPRLEKSHVERALVELFEVASGAIKVGSVGLYDFSDPQSFWQHLSDKYRSSGAWFSHASITGETLYNLVVLAVEARKYDQEYGKPSRWMATLKQQSPLLHAVNGFIWRLEYEYENSSDVLDAYFGQIIEGAVHLDIPQKDELQELWQKLDKMDLGPDEYDEVLALMARLQIDVDEEMEDVDFLEENGWPGFGIE
ncbi:hypothetical protein QBC38DRAFT_364586 [Podospora fimiseda]|uniref:Uncharacterized protein n=1 Tax=Podospora fimiseda TaxID=252190 RepID=A0AAN7BPR3_9PEZI|nr:hypothetical protein QBC38DRAFT_364586 [Podospora fimiseda]